MIGAIIGDTVGSVHEFNNIKATDVALTADFTAKQEKIQSLRGTLAELYERKDHLLTYEKDLLTALYIKALGNLQHERMLSDITLRRLKRKAELMQAKINRGEKPDVEQIEQTLTQEFERFQQLLQEHLDDIKHAQEVLDAPLLSDEDSLEMKTIYHQLVKRLHPDWNPDLTEKEKDLFLRAQVAYKMANLHELRNILLMLDTGKEIGLSSISEADAMIEKLEKSLSDLRERIKKIEAEFPFTFREQLYDNKWIASEQKKLQGEIDRLRADIEKWETYCSALIMQYTTNAEA